MKICLNCGTMALPKRKNCDGCRTGLAGLTAEVAPHPDNLLFGRIKARFDCRSCGTAVAINQLDIDGQIMCSKCGIDQKFDRDAWLGIFNLAHSVVDFGGDLRPSPGDPLWSVFKEEYSSLCKNLKNIGRRSIGYSDTTSGYFQGGEPEVHLETSLAHPVCPQCHQPLRFDLLSEGRCRTTCPSCSEQATYRLPILPGDYPDLRAAISPAHRIDHPEVVVAREGGDEAVAINCPSCGGPLNPVGRETMIRCEYCKTVSQIPPGLLGRQTGEAVKPREWFLLFKIPSPFRRRLLADLDRRQAREQELRKKKVRAEEEDREREMRRRAQEAKTNRLVSVVKTLLTLPFFAGIVYFSLLYPTGSPSAKPLFEIALLILVPQLIMLGLHFFSRNASRAAGWLVVVTFVVLCGSLIATKYAEVTDPVQGLSLMGLQFGLFILHLAAYLGFHK